MYINQLLVATYGAKDLTKVKKKSKEGPEEAKRRFIARYPFADVSKFEFDVELKTNGDIDKYVTSFKISDEDSYDITSSTFLNNKDFFKYPTNNKWPEIWSGKGSVPSFTNLRHPSNPKRKGWGHHEVIDTKFQKSASFARLPD